MGNYYNWYVEDEYENHVMYLKILSLDDYIKKLKEEIDTIDKVDKLCSKYNPYYKNEWDFYIIKKVIDNAS